MERKFTTKESAEYLGVKFGAFQTAATRGIIVADEKHPPRLGGSLYYKSTLDNYKEDLSRKKALLSRVASIFPMSRTATGMKVSSALCDISDECQDDNLIDTIARLIQFYEENSTKPLHEITKET